MTRTLAIVLSLLCAAPMRAQQTRVGSCDVGLAVRAEVAKRVDDRLVRDLLLTGTDACVNNAEFMQTFNEALFAVLEANPAAFVRQFARIRHQGFILEQLGTPVSDVIDPARIARTMARSAAPRDKSYKRIVRALKAAEAKSVGF